MSSSDHSIKAPLSQMPDDQNNDVKLRAQFNLLLKNAHENQHKLKRFEEIEFKLMAAESIKALLLILHDEYARLFKLDACTLLLDDTDLSLRHLIPESMYESQNNQFLTLLNFPVELEKLKYLPTQITTGSY
ncbi:MAG: hypothetical protein KAI17_24980 [Thiotrichaceae bacterium]|nr:hypothetical protein [Thiotrichaceae bacterium]